MLKHILAKPTITFLAALREAFSWAQRKQGFWVCTGHGDSSGLRRGHWYKGQATELLIHPGKHLRQELCLWASV